MNFKYSTHTMWSASSTFPLLHNTLSFKPFVFLIFLAFLLQSDLYGQCTPGPIEKIIQGTIYNDVNNNGTNDSEPGVPGVDVYIYKDVNQDGQYDSGDTYIATTTTANDGSYSYTHSSSTITTTDDFSSGGFAGGSGSWNGSWMENDPDGVYAGVTGERGFLHWAFSNVESMRRAVNLSGASSATLSFDWETVGLDAGKNLSIQLSSDGTTFTTIGSFIGTNTGSFSQDISSYISAMTTIRFINDGASAGNGDYGYFDNINIAATMSPTHFVIKSDPTTYPKDFVISTDNIESAAIPTVGNCDIGNDFGITIQDHDNDGIGDAVDLDDDNDGILDLDECTFQAGDILVTYLSNTDAGPAGHFNPNNQNAFTTGHSLLSAGPGMSISGNSTNSSIFLNGIDQATLAEAKAAGDYIENSFTTTDSWQRISGLAYGVETYAVDFGYTVTLEISKDGFVNDAVTLVSSYTLALNSGSGYLWSPFNSEYLELLDANTNYTIRTYVYANPPANGTTASFNDYHVFAEVCTNGDLDNNGVPNHLDTDSDGDNCPDAIEGGGTKGWADINTTTNRLTEAVDNTPASATYGVPGSTTQTIGSAQNSTQQNPVCDKCEPTNPLFVDNDNDGICNFNDLDDDNDGILDIDELACSGPPSVFNWDTYANGTDPVAISPITADGVEFTFGKSDPNNGLINYEIQQAFAGDKTIDWFQNLAAQNHFVRGVYKFSEPLVNLTFKIADIDSDNPQPGFIDSVIVKAYSYGSIITLNPSMITIGSSLKFNNDGTNTFVGVSLAIDATTDGQLIINFMNPPVDSIIVEYYNGTTEIDPPQQAIGIYGVEFFCTVPDTDNDGTPDYLDLDSDNDGCPDALEGGASFTFASIQNDTLTGGIDMNGVPTVAGATGQTIGASQNNLISIACNTTVAENDINQTPKNTAANGNVLTNDTDEQGDVQTVQSATYLDNTGTSQNLPLGVATNVYDASNTLAGSMTLNTNGTYTFTPATDYTGTVPVQYVTVDNNGNPATDGASLSIEVIPDPTTDGSNNPPLAQDDTNTAEQGGTVSTRILSNDSDPDGDALTVTTATGLDMSGSPVTLNGTPQNVYNANGVLAGQASLLGGEVVFTADTSYEGDVPVNYTISDGTATDNAVLTITVTPNEGNITTANDDANTGLQDRDLTGNILTNDNDPESNPQTVTTVTSSNGTAITPGSGTATSLTGIGTLQVGTDGSYTFNPDPNFTGTEVVKYVVCDNVTPTPACDTASLYLTVLPSFNTTDATNDYVNTPYDTPVKSTVLTNDRDMEGNSQTVNMLTVDSNGDGTPDMTKALGMSTSVGGVNGDGTPNNNAGILTLNTDGSYTFTPTPGFSGTVTYEYEVCDDGLPVKCETAMVEIEVLPQPSTSTTSLIASLDAYTTEENVAIGGNLLSNDNDPEQGTVMVTGAMIDTNGDGLPNATLTIDAPALQVAGKDKDGNAVANAGTLSINANGTFNFTPTAGFTGTVDAEYTATDSDGDTESVSIEIEVIGAGNNEVFANDDSALTDAEAPVSGNLLGNDFDPEGHGFAVTALISDSNGDGLPNSDQTGQIGGAGVAVGGTDKNGNAVANAGTLVLASDGTYTFTPSAGFTGNVNVDYGICDANVPSACDTAKLEITVQDVKRDYGDAPAAYPMVWHRAISDSDMNNVLDGTADIWLGTNTSFEGSQPSSATAEGDGFDDGVTFGAAAGNFPQLVDASTSYNVNVDLSTNSSSTVHYGMWIDWNDDGTYDSFITGSQVVNGSATAVVSITTPGGYMDETVNVRLRVSDKAFASTDFSGGRTNGEVEDFQALVLLPVELRSFTGKAEGCEVQLAWVAESEIRFSHYELERSLNGEDFQMIKEIEATGEDFWINYGYVDKEAFLENYYRLKMVDADGLFKYSEVIYVMTDCEEVLQIKDLKIYPNPIGNSNSRLTVKAHFNKEVRSTIIITDVLQRVVKKQKVGMNIGWNSIEMNVFDLPKGIYNLSILTGDDIIVPSQQFVKVNNL